MEWLLDNAGAVIQYRTLTEPLDESNEKKIDTLKRCLLSDSFVQSRLGNFHVDFTREMHGAKTEAYENVMGKLYEFGLRKGVKHPWFRSSVNLLTKHDRNDGLICFPRGFLPEKRSGC